MASSQRQLEETQQRVQEHHVAATKLAISKEELDHQLEQLKGRVRHLEIELAAAHAAATTQEQMIDTIRSELAAPASAKIGDQRHCENLKMSRRATH